MSRGEAGLIWHLVASRRWREPLGQLDGLFSDSSLPVWFSQCICTSANTHQVPKPDPLPQNLALQQYKHWQYKPYLSSHQGPNPAAFTWALCPLKSTELLWFNWCNSRFHPHGSEVNRCLASEWNVGSGKHRGEAMFGLRFSCSASTQLMGHLHGRQRTSKHSSGEVQIPQTSFQTCNSPGKLWLSNRTVWVIKWALHVCLQFYNHSTDTGS